MVRKSAAAAAEAVEDTAAEQLEGQTDIIDAFPGHGYVDTDKYDGETYDPTAQKFEGDHAEEQLVDDEDGGLLSDALTEAGIPKPEPAQGGQEKAPSYSGTEFEGMDEKTVRSRLYSRAQSQVLDKHKDEFYSVAEGLFKQYGMVFARKKTPREKAADEIRAKLKEFPELRAEFPGLGPVADLESTPPDAVIR